MLQVSEVYHNPKYYELAFSFRDIPAEVDVFEALVKQYSRIPVSHVLELGCGPAPHLAEHNGQRGLGPTGAATRPLLRAGENLGLAIVGRSSTSVASGRHGALLGAGPHKGGHFARARHHDLIDGFAPGPQATGAVTEAALGLPAQILAHRRHFCQPQLQVATDLGRVALGPRVLPQNPAGLRGARFREASLPPPFPPRGFTGDQPQVTQELTGGGKTREGAQCGNPGDGRGARNPAQRWARFPHRLPAPGLPHRLACHLQALPSFGRLRDRPDVRWADTLRGRGGTDDRSQPPPRRRRPIGPSLIPNIRAQEEGREPDLGRLEVLQSARARTPARIASSSTRGRYTGLRSPDRNRRARGPASRRSVCTRSPAFWGICAGAPPHPLSFFWVRERYRH
jgi:hypothetical protein